MDDDISKSVQGRQRSIISRNVWHLDNTEIKMSKQTTQLVAAIWRIILPTIYQNLRKVRFHAVLFVSQHFTISSPHQMRLGFFTQDGLYMDSTRKIILIGSSFLREPETQYYPGWHETHFQVLMNVQVLIKLVESSDVAYTKYIVTSLIHILYCFHQSTHKDIPTRYHSGSRNEKTK